MPAAAVGLGIGAIGAGVVGSYFGSQAQSNAASSAANAQVTANQAAIDAQMTMYNQARDDYAPYRRIGESAISNYQNQVNSGNPIATNALNDYWGYQSSTLPSANVSVSLPGSSVSMNQGKYLVGTNQAKVDPRKYNNINTGKYYVDPKKYQVDASAVTDFKMSQDDPTFQWKLDLARKNALQSLAGAGLSGSKYGMSVQNDALMGVMADEYENQYNRALNAYGIEYGQQADLYSRTADQQNLLYQRDYTKESDLYNRTAEQAAADWQRKFTQNSALYDREYALKSDNYSRAYQNAMANYSVASDNYNRAFQNASYTDNLEMNRLANVFNMGNALSDQKYQRALDAVKIGAGAASTAGNWAMNTGSNAAQLYQNSGQAAANAYTASGNAMANYYSGLGALPMNALAVSSLFM